MAGPNLAGLCAALGETFDTLTSAGEDMLAALDLLPPVWSEARPAWHLDVQERAYQVQRNLAHTSAERYRSVRLRVIAHWSRGGRWRDVIRLAGAWVGEEDPAIERARVYMMPLVCAVLFAAADAPTAANVEDFRRYLLRTVQDIAGAVILVKPANGLVFTLDTGPGLDIGGLAGEL